MYGKMVSACLHGIEGRLIQVEVDISNGLPHIALVVLPDSAIRESAERVRAALRNSGFSFPMERITVNLAPADLRKEGSAFDLAIAAAILTTSGQVQPQRLKGVLLLGELSLDGSVRTVPGVLSMVHGARQAGISAVILPEGNVAEALVLDGIEVYGIGHLRELGDADGGLWDKPANSRGLQSSTSIASSGPPADDYADVAGQMTAKRALVIAAAGTHNILLIGPPGTGKTMLARRLPTILPLLSEAEAVEVTKLYSVSGKLGGGGGLIGVRPFRAPHHTVSAAGLIGGGGLPKPGEASLAHRGVLFLDELPEFSRAVLEALPLEDRHVTIGRARAVYSYPANFLLAASMNPCPCGYYGATGEPGCNCSPLKVQQYRSRLSGPLLDRIDMHVEVPKPDYRLFHGGGPHLGSDDMREQVREARLRQTKRFAGDGLLSNAELSGHRLRQYSKLDTESEALLKMSFEAYGLSARAHDRVLKISRTIADLDGSEAIRFPHLAEALQYRCLDKREEAAG